MVGGKILEGGVQRKRDRDVGEGYSGICCVIIGGGAEVGLFAYSRPTSVGL